MTHNTTAIELLELLCDVQSIVILAATSAEPLKVKTIAETFEVSLPTAYRRINELVECNVLEKTSHLDEMGNTYHLYETNFQELRLVISEGRVELHINQDQTSDQYEVVNFRDQTE